MKPSLFSGINKYLLLLALFFGIFITIQLLFLFTRKNQVPGIPLLTGQKGLPTLTPFAPPTVPPPANLEFYRTIRNGQTVTEGQLITSEYKGKLTDFRQEIDSLYFKIVNEEEFENELSYGRNVPVDSTGLPLSDVKIGDNIILTETSDVSKSFPENIQNIKIVKYFPK